MRPELAERHAAAPAGLLPSAERSLLTRAAMPAFAVAALTIVGVAIRLVVADQSVFADELSTYWISATHGLGGVLSLLYGTGKIQHAEITPPLYFLAAWLTTQIGHTPELLRAPSVLAGAVTIPLVYLVGARTVGRAAALVGTALTAFSPFMIYYSTEARAYSLMMALVLVSTLATLLALETGRTRWWVVYAVSACAAFYTHYTCAFVLGAQFLWVLWAHPPARRPAIVATLGAAAGVLPWITGLVNDFTSPTLKILSGLSPFTAHAARLDLEHWAIGYPYNVAGGLPHLPGRLALILLGLSVVVAAAGLVARAGRRPAASALARIDKRILLVFALTLAAPVGEAVVSAGGNHIFGVRNLAASWPYFALSSATVTLAAGARAGKLAAGLAIVAFVLGGVKMLSGPFHRPDFQAAAAFVTDHARPGDVILDATGLLSPGPLTGLDIPLHTSLPVFRAEAPAERDHPFGFADRVVPMWQAFPAAAATASARGGRIFVVTELRTDFTGIAARVIPSAGQAPDRYRLIELHDYAGFGGTFVGVYADAGSSSR